MTLICGCKDEYLGMWLGITRFKIHDLTNSEYWLGFPRVESALRPIRELLVTAKKCHTPHLGLLCCTGCCCDF